MGARDRNAFTHDIVEHAETSEIGFRRVATDSAGSADSVQIGGIVAYTVCVADRLLLPKRIFFCRALFQTVYNRSITEVVRGLSEPASYVIEIAW